MNLRPLAYPELGDAGRFGNQLWEVASTVGIARAKGMRPMFPQEWPYRPYLKCPDSWFGTIAPKTAHPTSYARKLDHRCRGYLQDLSLWEKSTTEVRRCFQPTNAAQAVIDEEWNAHFADLPTPICAVHIRRGDYATNPVGTLTALPIDYYVKAVADIEPGSVVVFSDDIKWCRTAFPWAEVYYEGIPRPKEQEDDYGTAPVLDWIDLFLQARCQEHVISNSTYSWWGAWLSDNPSPRYPSRWYGDELSSYIDFRSMIPPEWKEIEVEDQC